MDGHELWLQACRNIGFDAQPETFPVGTATSADAAKALGCSIAQIAKSIVFNAGGTFVLVITSGQNNVDRKKKLRSYLNEKPSQATPEFVFEQSGYRIGGVPPFGHTNPPIVFMDEDLSQFDIVWAAAGSSNTVFPISPAKLCELSGALLVDVKQ